MSLVAGSTASPLRVLLVDDDVLARTALRLLLRSQPDVEVIGDTDDSTRILQLVAHLRPQVILLDVHMTPLSGVAVASTVRRRFPEIRIVLMSSFHGEDFADHAEHAGADLFISKTASVDVILAAIRGDQPDAQPNPRALSARETEIAELAARGYTNDQIASYAHLSTNTVKTYLSRIFRKLGARNRVEVAIYMRAPRGPHSAAERDGAEGQGAGVGEGSPSGRSTTDDPGATSTLGSGS